MPVIQVTAEKRLTVNNNSRFVELQFFFIEACR